MMTNTKMTVYNKYLEPFTHKTIFKKHVIDNVFWDDSLGINLSSGYENADKVNVYIPYNKNNLSDYKKPKQYNGEGWTLQNGDFMVKGETDLETVNSIKDLSNYEVFVMTVCDNKDFGSSNMQHFEIRGN
jgi:hypothetical protein